jgi:N-acyl-D-aspartate/D-glutamate deacylase
LKSHERIWARGAKVVPLTFPALTTVYMSLATGFVYGGLPDWAAVIALPIAERMRVLSDPNERRRLAAAASSEAAGMRRQTISAWDSQTVLTTFAPENKKYEGRKVGDIAAELGQDPFDVMLDIALRDELRTVFKARQRGNDDASWDLKREIWQSGNTVIGASDAGAHVDTIVTFNYATSMLAACRDRELLPLEEAIRLLTDVPARLYGIEGRGRLVEGAYADMMIFDPGEIGSGPVHWREDLPAGAGRLYAEAEGIEHVLVNGVEIVRGTELTGAVPGTVLRSGRDTVTPSIESDPR